MSTSDLDALLDLAVFRLMPEEVRLLVAESFEAVSYTFGSVVVREGDDGDSFYVVVAGTARVVKRSDDDREVPLNVLRPGDSFGEMGLLEDVPRAATVRASGELEVLRLDRSVFQALTRRSPAVREYFELLARHRRLRNFLRLHSVFGELPPPALDSIAREAVSVDVSAGETVFRQGDEPGSMFLVDEGRLRAFHTGEGADSSLAYLRTGDVFGERSLLLREPRAATVEAVTPGRLLRLDGDVVERLCAEHLELRTRLEERVAQYDYRRAARVPLDFAEELLPAEIEAAEPVGPRQVERAPAAGEEEAEPFEGEAEAPAPHRRRGRLPHVYQLDEMDCGAACLAMVCRYFGKAVGLPHLRELVHTSTDGTSLVGIARGARQLGLGARTVRASKSRLDRMPLPAIVHWEGNHWVVVYRVDDRRVIIGDPARGIRRVDRVEFDEKWTGYTVLLAYTPAFEAAPESQTSAAWLWSFVRPFRGAIGKAVLLALGAAALQLLVPIFTQIVVDRAIPEGNRGLMYAILAALLLVLGVIVASTVLQRYILSSVAVRIDTSALDFLTGRLLSLPMSYFTTRRIGDIERRLAGLRQVRQLLVQSGVLALTATAQLAAALALMFVYSWELALVYLATVPLQVALMRVAGGRLKPILDTLEEAYGRYASQQIDSIRGIETVKALAAEDMLRRQMLGRFGGLAERVFRAEFLVMTYQGAVHMITFLSLALFLFAGGLLVIEERLSLGEFVSFNALVALANGPALLLLSLWDQLQYARILVGRLNDVLEHEPEQGEERSGLMAVTTLEGRISLVDVGFRYGGPESPRILDGISFEVEPGTRVAIVGRSGSGKTTLVKCLAGLLEPTEGAIRYDGFELRTLDYRTLRRHIGFVLQENHLFDDTIASNIALGNEQPDLDRVVWASRAANAHDFVERLPLGYETRVGETGLRLSGGQQQRIAIARALYNRPPVLVLDEATSALDAESERAVKENMAELVAGRTSFVVAHRLSTIRDADVIVVIERGRLVEQGTHEELLERQGLYYYLASQQLDL